MTEDTKLQAPPTDRDVVNQFIAEAAEMEERAKIAQTTTEYEGLMYGAEARQILAKRLKDAKAMRLAYVQESADRLSKAVAEAGEKLSGFLVSTFQKAEDKANES